MKHKKLSTKLKLLIAFLAVFIAYYLYSSYILAHNSDIIVICTFGVILCMGTRCATFVSQNKKEGLSIDMDERM